MTDLDLATAVANYLETLPAQERPAAAAELQRFIGWVGGHQPVRALKPADIETYAANLDRAGDAGIQRAQVLKDFLGYLHRRKLTAQNLGAAVRVRRAAGRKAPAEKPLEQTANGQRVVLTPEGYERLKAELAELEAARPRIAAEMRRPTATSQRTPPISTPERSLPASSLESRRFRPCSGSPKFWAAPPTTAPTGSPSAAGFACWTWIPASGSR